MAVERVAVKRAVFRYEVDDAQMSPACQHRLESGDDERHVGDVVERHDRHDEVELLGGRYRMVLMGGELAFDLTEHELQVNL